MGDEDDEKPLPPWAAALVIGGGLLVAGAAVVLSLSDSPYGADAVASALVVGEPGREQLLVTLESAHGHEDDPTDYSYQLVFLDPATGAVARTEKLPGRTETRGGMGAIAAVGPHFWVLEQGGYTLRDASDPKVVTTQAQLAARHPDILGPWHQTWVEGSGLMKVESDDKKWWGLDPAGGPLRQLGPSDAPYTQQGPLPSCYTRTWRRPEGELAFLEVPSARYSQRSSQALARVTARDYIGLPTKGDPVGEARFQSPWFSCALGSDQPLTLADPDSALIHASDEAGLTYVARIRPDGSQVWRHTLPARPKNATEVRLLRLFVLGERVLVLRDRELTGLAAADGKLLWQAKL